MNYVGPWMLVVMNLPYSIKNWNRAGLKPSDPRFEIAGVLPSWMQEVKMKFK